MFADRGEQLIEMTCDGFVAADCFVPKSDCAIHYGTWTPVKCFDEAPEFSSSLPEIMRFDETSPFLLLCRVDDTTDFLVELGYFRVCGVECADGVATICELFCFLRPAWNVLLSSPGRDIMAGGSVDDVAKNTFQLLGGNFRRRFRYSLKKCLCAGCEALPVGFCDVDELLLRSENCILTLIESDDDWNVVGTECGVSAPFR